MKFAVALLLLVGFLCTGCQNLTVQQNATYIQAATSLATTGAMLGVSPANRPQVARYTYEVAYAINGLAQTNPDLTQITPLVDELLAQWDNPDKVTVGILIQETISLINTAVASIPGQTDSEKTAAIKAYLVAATTGIMNVTRPLAQGIPTDPTPAPKGVKVKTLIVKPLLWLTPKNPVGTPKPLPVVKPA